MQRRAAGGSKVIAAVLAVLVAGASGAVPARAEAPPQEPAPAAAGEVDREGTAVPTGVYKGVVTERGTGKPVPGAVLVFYNEETAETFEVTTDDKGQYELRLPAGEYVVDIRVGRRIYRSSGSFREEAEGRRWVMDFTIGSKLTERDLKIETTPTDIRVIPTEPRPPLEPSRKVMEFLIFIGGVIGVAALSD